MENIEAGLTDNNKESCCIRFNTLLKFLTDNNKESWCIRFNALLKFIGTLLVKNLCCLCINGEENICTFVKPYMCKTCKEICSVMSCPFVFCFYTCQVST